MVKNTPHHLFFIYLKLLELEKSIVCHIWLLEFGDVSTDQKKIGNASVLLFCGLKYEIFGSWKLQSVFPIPL